MRDIYQQEFAKKDQTILCQVQSRVDDTHYNLTIVPDTTPVLSNVPNMTPYILYPGDYCYVYKINNQLSNSFICDKVVVQNTLSSSDPTLTLSEERLGPAIQDMELTTNKTTVISGNSTDQQYPSARAVYTALSELSQEVTHVYVVDAEQSSVFASDTSQIVLEGDVTDIEGNTVQISSLHLGDSFFVLQDLYPNRWVSEINSGAGTVTLNSTRVDSGAGTVEDVTVNGSSVVQNNIAVLTTGAGLTASGGEMSLTISGFTSTNPKTLSYSDLNNLNIYLQSGGAGYKAAVSNLPYSRLVVQDSDSEDLNAVNTYDFIFARNS